MSNGCGDGITREQSRLALTALSVDRQQQSEIEGRDLVEQHNENHAAGEDVEIIFLARSQLVSGSQDLPNLILR